jgi:hypothetical protein
VNDVNLKEFNFRRALARGKRVGGKNMANTSARRSSAPANKLKALDAPAIHK